MTGHADENALCSTEGSPREQLAEAWEQGHAHEGCVYYPDCIQIGHHVNPYRTLPGTPS